MAARHGLDHGPDVLWTYGPTGFLHTPTLWYRESGAAAVAYRLATLGALAGLVLALGRRTLGVVAAAVAALLLIATAREVTPVLVAGAGGWLLARAPARPAEGRRTVTAFAVTAGALGGLEVLTKVSTGLFVLALGALAVALLPRGRARAGAQFGAAAAGTGLLVWLASGQSPGALPAWVAGEASIVAGYSAAMGLEEPGRAWEHAAAAALVLLGAAAALLGTRGRAGPRVLALWALLALTSWKAGFVRHDGHSQVFFAAMAGGLALLPWRRGARPVAVGAVAAAVAVLLAAADTPLREALAPVERARAALDDLRTTLDGERAAAVRAAGAARLRGAVPLDPIAVGLLRRGDVHVAPYSASLVWAYGLRWDPLPVFQPYQAYTDVLDDRNAARAAAADGPDRVLLTTEPPIDGRHPAWEGPATSRALLCRFRPEWRTEAALVLARARASRCGPERPRASVAAGWGERVGVPRPSGPGRMVVLRVRGAGVRGTERLRSLLRRAHERFAVLTDRRGRRRAHRLQPGVLGQGVPVVVPAGADLPGPFALGTAPVRLELRRGGDPPAGRPLRLDFSELEVRPW